MCYNRLPESIVLFFMLFSAVVLSTDQGQDEEGSYIRNLDELTKENTNATPSNARLQLLMKLTFSGRRRWIQKDTPSVSEITDVFPLLKSLSRVSFT